MRMIQLNKINRDPQEVSEPQVDSFSDSDDVGEPQAVASAPLTPDSQPASINVEAIRCFYARKDARPGTRITFTDGGGFAVTESYDEVLQKVVSA